MNLKKELRASGFDLIDGPIRNHKPLQLWLKKTFTAPELYYEKVTHALHADHTITIQKDNALSIDYGQTNEFKFNIGITILEQLLTSLGLGNLGLSTVFEHGKSVSISYNNSKTLVAPIGEVTRFLSEADFVHPNKELIRNANDNNILIISGVITAKDLKATIETDTELDTSLTSILTDLAEGQASFNRTGDFKLEMTSEGNSPFPIAVKANRIDWDKGEFDKISLVTDSRYYF